MLPRAVMILILIVCLGGYCCPSARSDTILLEGRLDSRIRFSKEMRWTVDRRLSELTVWLAMPATFSNRAVSQTIEGLRVEADPRPAAIEDEADETGNRHKKITWRNLGQDARVRIVFEAAVRAALAAMESREPLPLRNMGREERRYLRATEQVQSDRPEFITLSKKLTGKATTEYEAVTAILDYVADEIKYTYNPPHTDALATLTTKTGNCTNIAHISMALLRAAGIPARMVGGTTLNKQRRIPIDHEKYLVKTMGQGGHAWIEVYFPDLGWLSYDPKQSKQFTSTRHVKDTHGLDYKDVVDTWTGSPYAPAYTEAVEAHFVDDSVDVKLMGSQNSPRSYLASNRMLFQAATVVAEARPAPIPPHEPAAPAAKPPSLPPVTSEPPVLAKPPLPPPVPEPPTVQEPPVTSEPPPVLAEPTPPPVPVEEPPVLAMPTPPPVPKKPQPAKGRYVEFGNMDFPALVDTYRIVGNTGMMLLDTETAEYVTSEHVYAQAFSVDQHVSLKDISLAMHKFGGDGTLYVDVVSDDGGKPALRGWRSLPIFLDRLARKPGYHWVTFAFAGGPDAINLEKGKYWVVVRHSGEAVVTWFFIPGKPYGGPDDTRSTLKGHRWEDILTCDFVFRVRGLRGGG